MEYYVHHVPGRLRVRIPEIRNNARKAAEIQQLFDVYGVETLKINHLTGSVVATFDPQVLTAQQLLNILKEEGLYDSARAITHDQQIQRVSSIAAARFGRAFFGYAVGKALEASGLPLLAALI